MSRPGKANAGHESNFEQSGSTSEESGRFVPAHGQDPAAPQELLLDFAAHAVAQAPSPSAAAN